jgi:DNA repair ATPase RecN
MQKKVIKVEFASIDQLDTELKANRGEFQSALSKFKTLKAEIESLRDSYAFLSGQYDSMKNAAMTIGDSKLTEKIVKALNESRDAYNEVNKIFQAVK